MSSPMVINGIRVAPSSVFCVVWQQVDMNANCHTIVAAGSCRCFQVKLFNKGYDIINLTLILLTTDTIRHTMYLAYICIYCMFK
jgi:hypothetical protein